MDGRQKIKYSFLVFFGAIALFACNTRQMNHVGLFVGEPRATADSTELYMSELHVQHIDTFSLDSEDGLNHAIRDDGKDGLDTLSTLKELTGEDGIQSGDSVVTSLAESTFTDSLKVVVKPDVQDTVSTEKRLTEDFSDELVDDAKEEQASKPDSLDVIKSDDATFVDDKQVQETSRSEQKQGSGDTLALLLAQMKAMQDELRVARDTVFISGQKSENVTSEETGNNDVLLKEMEAQNSTIAELREQVQGLQNQLNELSAVPAQTVVVPGVTTTDKDDAHEAMEETIREQQLTIALLQQQIDDRGEADETDVDSTAVGGQENRELLYDRSDKTNEMIERYRTQNDSIELYRNQLEVIANSGGPATDSTLVQESGSETQSALKNENVGASHADSSNVNSEVKKEEIKNTDDREVSGSDAAEWEIEAGDLDSDTIDFVVYYKLGATIPMASKETIERIKEVYNGQPVRKVILSGYTDSSGSSSVNRRITNKRLDYFVSELRSFIPSGKLFTQNFGDEFTSDTVVEAERRLEIKLVVLEEDAEP